VNCAAVPQTPALRQSSGPGGGQAEFVAAIERFRAAAASDGSTPLADALYLLRLREDARFCLRGNEFVTADRPALEAALDATAA